MKKAIVGVASVLASALLMAGCNKQVIDLTYEYNWAQLKMPDGTAAWIALWLIGSFGSSKK